MLVEGAYDSVYFEGRWHRRQRRRVWFDDGSRSPWQTEHCDPLLRQPMGEA